MPKKIIIAFLSIVVLFKCFCYDDDYYIKKINKDKSNQYNYIDYIEFNFNNKNYEKVINLCSDFKEFLPNSFYLNMIYRSYNEMNNFKKSIQFINNEIKDNFQKYYLLGKTYLKRNWLNEANYFFEKALDNKVIDNYQLISIRILNLHFKLPEYWIPVESDYKYIFAKSALTNYYYFYFNNLFSKNSYYNLISIINNDYKVISSNSSNVMTNINYFSQNTIKNESFTNFLKDKKKDNKKVNESNILGAWFIVEDNKNAMKSIFLYIFPTENFNISYPIKNNYFIKIIAISYKNDFNKLEDEFEIYLNKLYQIK